MELDTSTMLTKLSKLASKAGFKPFNEFSAVDSLIYKNNDIAFYNLKSCNEAATAILHNSLKFVVEVDCEFEVRLMGKACEFVDFNEFEKRCETFFNSLISDKGILVINMKSSKPYQSMPLSRLARDVSICLRFCVEED